MCVSIANIGQSVIGSRLHAWAVENNILVTPPPLVTPLEEKDDHAVFWMYGHLDGVAPGNQISPDVAGHVHVDDVVVCGGVAKRDARRFCQDESSNAAFLGCSEDFAVYDDL